MAGFVSAAIVMSDERCCIAAGHLAGYSMPGSLMNARINDGGVDSATTPASIVCHYADHREPPQFSPLTPGVSLRSTNSCNTVLITRVPVPMAKPVNTSDAPRFDSG